MRFLPFHWTNALGTKESRWTVVTLALVLLISFFTHFKGYAEPEGLFWDENYHIPAAQKYLDRIFFMEYHPPLGKLLIALGAYLVEGNSDLPLDELRSESYIKGVPKNFNYSGMRLFPALFGWLSVSLFFLIMLEVSGHRVLALVFTTPYLFENGLIVHFRGAMLDSFLVFFVLLSVYVWLRFIRQRGKLGFYHFVILGLCIGCAVSVKLTGGVLLLLPLFLTTAWTNPDRLAALRDLATCGFALTLGVIIPFLMTWYVHFALGSNVFNNNLYKASADYQEVISRKETAQLKHMPLMLRDTLRFFSWENRGVPKLDVCKPGENGSFPMSWIIGAKSINYRWTKHPDGSVSYLYLLMNPVVLLLSFAALVFSMVLVGGRLCYGLRPANSKMFLIVAAMSGMYLSYMLVMLKLGRVMYLYHYFPPYVFMLIAGAALLCNSFGDVLKKNDRIVWCALLLLSLNVFLAYEYFSPLSYYEPLTLQEFNSRIWFSPWRLEPIN